MYQPKLKRVMRLDSIPVTDQTFFTPEGYLRDRPILTSTGIFEYSNSDGSIRRELRLPEEVFDPESLKSYQGKPIIVTHDAGLVDKDNVSDEQIGTILTEGYRDGDDVRAGIIIHNTDEMKECGLKELSLGYNLDLDEKPGVWNGQHYDAIQRNIRINHLALVGEARAGDQARLNIDSRDTKKILIGGKKAMSVTKTRKKHTKSRRHDGVLSPEELKKAIEEYKAKRAARMSAKADEDTPTEEAVSTTKPQAQPDVKSKADNDTAPDKDATVEEKVEMVKDRRDRRDEEGDPETVEEAQGIIANQDDDIDILFDIIDTLLAEKEFDEADNESALSKDKETAEDEDDEEAAVAEDEDELEEEAASDEDDVKKETAEDEDDEEAAVAEDEDELEEEAASDEDDVAEDEDDEEGTPAGPAKVNADSIDRMVRQRVKLGMIGSILNVDGLEDMSPMRAKKTVIKMVRPNVRLDGKSASYIDAMFDLAYDEIKARTRKDTSYQKRQMFNKDGRSGRPKRGSALDARQKMINRQHRIKKEGK